MSDYYHPSHGEDQTNTDAVRSCYAVPHLMMVYGTEASRIATFDRWLNAKLAEAWGEGFESGKLYEQDAQHPQGGLFMSTLHATNPYRTEES